MRQLIKRRLGASSSSSTCTKIIISTPNSNEDEDEIDFSTKQPLTPSPTVVDEFHTDHLVTVNDDEVIITSSLSTLVSLPELEDIQCIGIGSYCDHQNDHADADNITTPTANTNNKKLHSPGGRWTSSPRRTSTSPRSPKDVVTCSPTIQHR